MDSPSRPEMSIQRGAARRRFGAGLTRAASPAAATVDGPALRLIRGGRTIQTFPDNTE